MQTSSVSKISITKSRRPSLLRLRSLLLTAIMVGTFATAVAADWKGSVKDDGEHWVETWGTAVHAPDLGVPGLANLGFSNQTLRQIVHVSVGGNKVRVRLSSFGANAVVIGSAHIALHATGAMIVPASDRTLTFGGKPSNYHPGWCLGPERPCVPRCAGAKRPGGEHLCARRYRSGCVAL
jgi:hypothetical protein